MSERSPTGQHEMHHVRAAAHSDRQQHLQAVDSLPLTQQLTDKISSAARSSGLQLPDSGRFHSIQRQGMVQRIGQISGNRQLERMITHATLQRSNASSAGQIETHAGNDSTTQQDLDPGRAVTTLFGEYWVVPDDARRQGASRVAGEWITESQFAVLERTWQSVQSGTGRLRIAETDSSGQSHSGFKDQVLVHISRLLSRPSGRSLITSLVNGSKAVTVLPSAALLPGGGQTRAASRDDALLRPNGRPSRGSQATITIDPNLRDTDVLVLDASGREIADPVFIILGHELIHAHLITRGRDNLKSASDPAYPDVGEEQTIATGNPSENRLRSEHGLPLRHGHAGRDSRITP